MCAERLDPESTCPFRGPTLKYLAAEKPRPKTRRFSTRHRHPRTHLGYLRTKNRNKKTCACASLKVIRFCLRVSVNNVTLVVQIAHKYVWEADKKQSGHATSCVLYTGRLNHNYTYVGNPCVTVPRPRKCFSDFFLRPVEFIYNESKVNLAAISIMYFQFTIDPLSR